MRLPGVIKAGERRRFAMWNDLNATILAASGLASPTTQGFDLLGPLSRGEESPRRCAVSHLYKACALATERWKLEYGLEEGSRRLWDRVNDPLEQYDLWTDPRTPTTPRDETRFATWRSDLTDVQWLQEHKSGGGPVAVRRRRKHRLVSRYDAERRLNDRAEAIDARSTSNARGAPPGTSLEKEAARRVGRCWGQANRGRSSGCRYGPDG